MRDISQATVLNASTHASELSKKRRRIDDFILKLYVMGRTKALFPCLRYSSIIHYKLWTGLHEIWTTGSLPPKKMKKNTHTLT